jgi:hypothetical protein
VHLDNLLWKAIEKSEPIETLFELERDKGFDAAQKQVTTYLSDPDFAPLADLVLTELKGLNEERDVGFYLRLAGALRDS